MKLTTSIIAVIAVFGMPAWTEAQSFTLKTTDGTDGVSGQVQYGTPGTSGFGGTQWHVKNSGPTSSTTRKGYVRFDAPGNGFAPTHAALELTVSLIDAGIGDNDQTVHVYGITNQALDAWSTSGMTWENAPANDTGSAYAADLTQAEFLGTFVLDYNGDKAAPVGTVIRFSSQALVDLMRADTNGLVTLIFGRTGSQASRNLLFAGDTHATYAPPTLRMDDLQPPAVVDTASIVIPDTGSPGPANLEANPAVLSFNAGATANKLVVALSSETSGGSHVITYNGVPLVLATGSANGKFKGVYYLDNPYTGGFADLVVDMTGYATVNGIGVGIVSISGAAPGVAATANAPANSVTITPSDNGSFVVAGFTSNDTSGGATPNAPLTSLYGAQIGSLRGAAGYEADVLASPQTYAFAPAGTTPTIGVAAFAPGVIWSAEATPSVASNSAMASATVNQTLTEAVLVWDTSDKGTGSTNDWTFRQSLGGTNAGVVSAQLTYLNGNTPYTWRLYGTNSAAHGWSDALTFTTLFSAAQTPVFTNALALSPSSIQLDWQDNAPNETGYVLQRSSVGATGPYTFSTNLGVTTSYTDSGLLSSTTYYYQLAATNAVNGSATDFTACRTNAATEATLLVTWTTPGTSEITATSAVASATVGTSIDETVLVWDLSDKGTGSTNDWAYRRSLGPTNAGVVNGQITNMNGETYYTWRYYGENASTNGWSSAETFLSGLGAGQKPVFTAAAAVSVSVIQLGWQDNAASETSYVLQRSTTEGSGYVTVVTLGSDTTSYTDSGLASGTTYYYQLAASNAVNGTATAFSMCRTNVTTDTSAGIVTTDGTGGLSGQLDYDDGGGFGGTQWHVKNSGLPSGTTRKGYVRFDTSGIDFRVTHAAFELTVSLIDVPGIGDSDQTIHVYGITNQALDAVALTNGLPWANAPANDAGSPYAADLTQAEFLGAFVLDGNGDKAAPVGTVVRATSQELVDFLNADTNGVVTILFGRTGAQDEKNLLFAGDTHGTYSPPTLIAEQSLAVVDLSVSNITATSASVSATLLGKDADVTVYWDAGPVADPAVHTGWDGTNGPNAETTGTVARTVSILSADTMYTYAFYATNNATGSNAWSVTATFTTGLSSAQAPEFSSATALSRTSIELNWLDNAAYETGYVLQRSTTEGSGYSTIATLGAMTTYTDSGLAPNTTYYYQLAATNAANGTSTDFAQCRTSALSDPGFVVLNTASIVIPDTGSPGTANLEANPAVLSFDAGAMADKLIVSLSAETGAGTHTITYNGVPLILAAGTANGRHKGICYLDNPYTGGVADLIVDMTGYSTVNGIGVGVISVSGAAPGVNATANAAANSIAMTPYRERSLVVAGFSSNNTTGAPTPNAPLTALYGAQIGSARGAAGFDPDVPSSPQTYSFSPAGTTPTIGAAVFLADFPPPPPPTLFISR